MHVIIAAITAIAGLIWALNTLQRSGFDLNSLNPFFWARRRQWEKKQVNPLYSIETPHELASLLMFAVMRQAGDPTAEQKAHLLGLYQSELRFTEHDAQQMYALSSHLINTDPNYMHKVGELMAPSLPHMSEIQQQSIGSLVSDVANFSGTLNSVQTDFLQAIDAVVTKPSH